MLENPKRTKWKFSLFLLLIFIVSYGKAQVISLENLKISNLPDSYKDVFKLFFLEKLNLTKQKTDLKADIEIKWLALNYNTCIYIKEKQKLLEANCFTSSSAEKYLDDLKENLQNSSYIRIKKPFQIKPINLKLIINGNLTRKKALIISKQGDKLTDYKPVFAYKGNKGKFITLGGATISQDIIVLEENSSAFLLQKFLNGYKIDKVYLIK